MKIPQSFPHDAVWTTCSDIESGGCGTFTGIYEAYPNGPVKVLDEDDKVIEGGSPTGYWLLMSSLTVYDGAVLQCHGVSDGGDCDVLRIQSDGSKDFHEVRGHGGSLSFYGTKVTSWDTDEGEQQKTYKGGRSFINCVSEVQSPSADCAKNDRGECRMVRLIRLVDVCVKCSGRVGYRVAQACPYLSGHRLSLGGLV